MKSPYNSFARARKVSGKRERRRRQERVVAIQQFAKGKTETIAETPKVK
ncbi:hypothetical protein AAHB41_04315 [Pediococcus pentosaceus]|jgi:hypothetical protein|uniref:Uncharacterized protein n=3 Tax=Pediococcus pentosaceus TaxID=1255 RepID=A0A1Y0VLY4_PEDPE|nr:MULTISPECIES: hypothetical protein [Pediococcus]ABJ68483.1 hypothetical protein PEPE_1452 [Pediococcus pentosaceus ATCC 25745]AHA05517.1 hypothetical protein T256_07175 [Pediococcus pentosaceus SL4]ARW19202.1 hypothetical protein S100892_00607 [Pediococcus pentosaceus]ASC08003.1 hypothetical protein S100194_00442 [Pediococcus pentosaceus]AXR43920.1 hypothetical protein CKK51_07310 [Pediococcus pentosaceus]